MRPGPAVRPLLAQIRRRHQQLGRPVRALSEKAYLKSELQFHGVSQPDVRATAALVCKQNPDLGRAQLLALADALYATYFHDLRSVAVALLERRRALLEPDDLGFLIDLVRRSPSWAHVDWVATKLVGTVVSRLPAAARRAHIRRWARDPDVWVRRTALLAQHDVLRAGGGDFPLFAAIAVPMLGDKEFWIRKAIGWVLREVSKRRPELVFAFLRRHRQQLAGLTFREGSRQLPPRLRAQLVPPAGRSSTRRSS
jgi:3-methyladenine DNA glycosylase AlkD